LFDLFYQPWGRFGTFYFGLEEGAKLLIMSCGSFPAGLECGMSRGGDWFHTLGIVSLTPMSNLRLFVL
jgi:hypothetical protein